MNPQELVAQGQASLAKHGETFAKAVIADIFDPAVATATEQIKAAIPGELFDVVIDIVAQNFAPALKASLLAQVEKISTEV